MKIDCNIIEDLLPLYAENVCSEESRKLVEEHCAKCEKCRGRLEAQNIPLPEKKIDKGAKNPLKKAKKHYVRLAVIIALICAVLAVPAWRAFELTVAEITQDHMRSWSRLSMDNDMKRFAEAFMSGNYKAALDMVDFTYSTGAANLPYEFMDGGERLRADYAEMLSGFTEKFPVKSYEYIATATGSKLQGEMDFYLENYHTSDYTVLVDAEIYVRFTFIDGQLYLTSCALNPCFSPIDPANARTVEVFKEDMSAYFAKLEFYGNSAVRNFEDMIKSEYYENAYNVIMTTEYMELISEQWSNAIENSRASDYDDPKPVEKIKARIGAAEELEARIDTCRKELAEKARALFSENYTFVSIYGDDPYFSTEPAKKGSIFEEQGCFRQNIHISMETKEGTPFEVSFTAQAEIFAAAPFENITYSENTPEGFKRDFEELFS